MNNILPPDFTGNTAKQCGLCGQTLGGMDGHHLNPRDKKGNPSQLKGERQKAEWLKCLRVCKQCHSIIHFYPYEMPKEAQEKLIKIVALYNATR